MMNVGGGGGEMCCPVALLHAHSYDMIKRACNHISHFY